MSSGHLGMKWSLFIWDLDRCSNFGVWIMLGFATVRRSAFCIVPPPVAVVVVAHSSVASVASLPAPASLMLDRSSRRLSGAPHAPAKPFDQKLTSALCAVWWKECAIDVSLHTHRYECIYHRYLLRHRPICHHVRWLVCDSSLTLTAWR